MILMYLKNLFVIDMQKKLMGKALVATLMLVILAAPLQYAFALQTSSTPADPSQAQGLSSNGTTNPAGQQNTGGNPAHQENVDDNQQASSNPAQKQNVESYTNPAQQQEVDDNDSNNSNNPAQKQDTDDDNGSNNNNDNPAQKQQVDDNDDDNDSSSNHRNPAQKQPVDRYNDDNDDVEYSACNHRPYPKDVDGHWAEIYVRRLYDLCIVQGYNEREFRPNQPITRAELVKMALASKSIAPKSGCYDEDCGSPFKDLLMWQGPWVRKAWDLGIVQGYNGNEFRPNQNITRAEAVKVVLATYGYHALSTNVSFFKDVKGWSVGWIQNAFEMGIVQGMGDGTFQPDRAITRAEAAKVIVKMMEYWDTHIQ